QVGNAPQAVAFGVATPHRDRKRVVEAERLSPYEPEPLRVVAHDGGIHALGTGDWGGGTLQHGGVRRPRVLDVQVDAAGGDRLVTDQRSPKVEPALDGGVGEPLVLLPHDPAGQV